MFVKFGSTVTPAYLHSNNDHLLAGNMRVRCGVRAAARRRVANLLEEFQEGPLREDNLGLVPVEHT